MHDGNPHIDFRHRVTLLSFASRWSQYFVDGFGRRLLKFDFEYVGWWDDLKIHKGINLWAIRNQFVVVCRGKEVFFRSYVPVADNPGIRFYFVLSVCG